MKPSDALDVLALVRLIWRLPAPSDPKDDHDLTLWPAELADVDFDNAQTAVRRFNASNFPPTVLQVANVARAEGYFRAGHLELPEPDGLTAEQWLEQASDEDRERFARVSPRLREKFGIDLGEETA